jgi:ABC-type phosphate/phosphonate transport system ATPase subunit
MDKPLARDVLTRLKSETRQARRTVVCVLHDDDLVGEFADAVLSLTKDNPTGWSLRPRAA